MVGWELAGSGELSARRDPSPGIREFRWLKPVYPDDVICCRSTPQLKIALGSKPDWGLLVTLNEGENQKGETVTSFLGQLSVERCSRNP